MFRALVSRRRPPPPPSLPCFSSRLTDPVSASRRRRPSRPQELIEAADRDTVLELLTQIRRAYPVAGASTSAGAYGVRRSPAAAAAAGARG